MIFLLYSVIVDFLHVFGLSLNSCLVLSIVDNIPEISLEFMVECVEVLSDMVKFIFASPCLHLGLLKFSLSIEVLILEFWPFTHHLLILCVPFCLISIGNFVTLIFECWNFINLSLKLLNFVLEIIIGLLILPLEFLSPVSWSILFIFSGVVHVQGVGCVDLSILLIEFFSLSFKSTNSSFHIFKCLLFLFSSNFIKILLMLPVLLIEVINESV
jgi:hypothetical protein